MSRQCKWQFIRRNGGFLLLIVQVVITSTLLFCGNFEPLPNSIRISLLSDDTNETHASATFNVGKTVTTKITLCFNERIEAMMFGVLSDTTDTMIDMKTILEVHDTVITGAIDTAYLFNTEFNRSGRFLLVAVAHEKSGISLFDTLYVCISDPSDTPGVSSTGNSDCTIGFAGDKSEIAVSDTSCTFAVISSCEVESTITVYMTIADTSGDRFSPLQLTAMLPTGAQRVDYTLMLNDRSFASHSEMLTVFIDSIAGEYVIATNHHTLLFTDTAPQFNVIYNGNGATHGEVPKDESTYREGDTVLVAVNSGDLSLEGKTFVGWNTESSGDDGTFYTPGATFFMGNGNIELFATWTMASVYTVTYNGNGNSGGSAPAEVSNEAEAEISVAGRGTLVKKGYSFKGWNAEPDGSGTVYEQNSTFTLSDENDTLYAQWEINLYSIVYNGNCSDAEYVPRSTNHIYHTEVTLDSQTPTRIGYTFFRWNTSSSGEGVHYKPGDPFIIPDSNITLYARWDANSYALVYNGNGNNGGTVPGKVTVNYRDTVTIATAGDLALKGYTFTGWNTERDGGGNRYPADTVIAMESKDITLYAQWELNHYTVRFDLRGGGEVADTTIDYGGLVTVPITPVREGYTFDAWYRDSEFTTPWDFVSDTVTEDIALYAKWTIVTFSVKFNTQGGTSTDTVQKINYGNVVKKPADPVRTGYTFDAWYGDSTYTKLWVFASDIVKGSMTLFAKWKSPTGMVLINARNKTFTMGSTESETNESNEWPEHQVQFSADFWMDTTEVTQGHYRSFMTSTYNGYTSPQWSDSMGKGDTYPVYLVNWYDAALYCNARTKATRSNDTVYKYTSISGSPGNGCTLAGVTVDVTRGGFRLPSEAQWEYACRAGTTTKYYWKSDSVTILQKHAWYRDNSASTTHPVAKKLKNPFGLYDMNGNVWEWCNDWYGDYSSGVKTDPEGPSSGTERVLRGGHWGDAVSSLRSANRHKYDPVGKSIVRGFRISLPAR